MEDLRKEATMPIRSEVRKGTRQPQLYTQR
jgi:hypothetical protein